MALVYITRKEHFNAAHKLWNSNWTEKKNFETFGKCANPNWHGHNYVLYVTVVGEPHPDTGYFINLRELSNMLQVKVIDKLDHKNLNLDVDFLKDIKTSCENISIAIWNEINNEIVQLGGKLHCVKLCETENNYVEYFGK